MTASTPVPAPAELVGRALRDLARHSPADLERWMAQVRRLGGCRHPVRLTGESVTVHAATGEVLHAYTTATEPHGHLLVRCNNRRASRCPACSAIYRRDAFHLVRAGLAGGKGIPDTVRTHPRVFVTLTAPSFGPVHTGPDKHGRRRVCHPRRTGPVCWQRHAPDDPLIGQPLDPATYDYTGAVLWQAHAGELWRRLTIYLRRELARAAGLTLKAFTAQARVSYAKVAEFQRRGLVHFHAVIRLDGRHPTDSDTVPPPPPWASVALLDQAIRAAAARAVVRTPHAEGISARVLRWGHQVDIRPITTGDLATGQLTEQAVAGYIAKYATKAAEAAGTLDRPIRAGDLPRLERIPEVTDHARRMIATCWRLGGLPELAHLRLRKWAHMLAFRGHFLTKARHYSTTFGALRAARAEHREQQTRERLGLPGPETTLVLAHWAFAGQGYTPGESILAAGLTPDPDPSPQEGERACA